MEDSEKSKVLELLKEMRSGSNIGGDKVETDSSCIGWMYKGPSELVNKEEYLLGKAIDKSFELLNNAGSSDACLGRTSEQSNVPKRLLEKTDSTEQVDIAKKILEDPLYAIRQKELEARKKLLNNPVKLKQIKQMLLERNKGNISIKKKKNSKKKISVEDLDKKIMKRLMKFSKKEKRKALNHIMRSDSDYSSSDSNSSAYQESNSKKTRKRNKSLNSKTSSSTSTSTSDNNSETNNDSEFERKNKSLKRKKRKSRSKGKETIKKTKHSRSSDFRNCNDGDKKTKHKKNALSKKNHVRKISSSSTGSSTDSSSTSSDSDSNETEEEPKKSSKTCKKSSSQYISHFGQSNIDKKVKNYEKETFNNRIGKKEKKRNKIKKSSSDNPKTKKNYGLMMPDGSKPETKKDYSSVQKYEKPVEAKTKFVVEQVKHLSEKEKEEKLKEMMKDAKLRKEDREKSLARHRKIQTQEDDLKTYDSDFIRRQMSHLTSQGTMADRIKSNINNIQRSKSSMDNSFMRK